LDEQSTPIIHQKSLARFDFDSILLLRNYQLARNYEFAANLKTVLKIAQVQNVAIQIIKGAQRRPWAERDRWAETWYEPYHKQKSIDVSIHWALLTQMNKCRI